MEKKITVESKGFKIEGEFISSKSKFTFEVWEVVCDVSGEHFQDIREANAKVDADLSEFDIAIEAGKLAGVDYADLCEMTWLES